VLFAPLWVEPIGRLHMGADLDLELALLSDVDRYSRVWQISTRGGRHPFLQKEKPTQSFSFGPILLSLFEKQSQAVLFDFTRRIRQAQVERVGDQLVSLSLAGQAFFM